MSEKKGHLVKLHFDFDTAGVLEIWMPNLTVGTELLLVRLGLMTVSVELPNLLSLKV